MSKDIEILLNLGYRVIEKKERIHFHVFYGNTFLNLWPTGKKYMSKNQPHSTTYEDIQEVIDYMTNSPQEKARIEHEQGLGAILDRINKKHK